MSDKICPYPGLRPFTEEESIFFKGRDTHIRQIIRQLETNKIVIITGASGDGKSSLVYAGVIPNARAGFFRAKHSNWLIADFRPERSPLTKLSETLANCFAMEPEGVYNELSLGFSALIDLYKSTPYALDKSSDQWLNASEKIKRGLKDKAANLLILADQFEEFFTNTENFSHGNASNEAYTTVNLLLETAQIALEQDLPIYVVFTMRSDFISQCVAFKGLPEAIGFSQFFIPRLKRHELQQVIEEPAILSGGKVSKRLVEVLINDLREGFDQLPVLQHALNQLWKVAENGNVEIDLIHLAKIAGLDTNLLPDNDKKTFAAWLAQLSEQDKKHFEKTSLANVLNTHANILYETAFEYQQGRYDWANKQLTKAQSETILKLAFQSLTKIDGGRAVRNRMTLLEITQIASDKNISYESVCAVLNIYRLQDNTLIRPFIDKEDLASVYLASDTILDITHEALIRNWNMLRTWLAEEQSNYNDYQDFSVQLNRWLQNNKENTYLLNVGSLAHFQEWYAQCKPNKYWIAKYDSSPRPKEEKLKDAEITAQHTIGFLEASHAQILALEKTKKRRRRITLALFSFVILVLAGFTFWAIQEKAFAQAQKQEAQAQKQRAEKEMQMAQAANQKAEAEKAKAIASEQNALLAREASEKAYQEANKQRKIAQIQSSLAKKEADAAQKAEQLAVAQQQIANEERKLADNERQRAELANDSAQKLTYLFVAQTLAYKSTNDYDDPQLNLLLAETAYRFHTKYNGRDNSPAISSGLKSSLSFDKYSNAYTLPFENPIAFTIQDNGFMVIDQNNRLAHLSDDMVPRWDKAHAKTKAWINKSIVSNGLLLVCYEDGKTQQVNNQGERSDLVGQAGLLRVALYNPEKELLITGYRNGNVYLYSLAQNKIIGQTTLIGGNRPVGICLDKQSQQIYIAGKNGHVLSWNTNRLSADTLHSTEPIASMAYVSQKNILILGLANGQIQFYNLKSNKVVNTIRNSISAVEHIVLHADEQYFATAAAGGEIRIYDFAYLNETPLTITDHGGKVKQLHYTQNRLWALTNKGKLFFWENDYKQYEKEVRKRLKRQLNKKEWDAYVGEKIPYQAFGAK